jgi:hypothetical protein
MLGNRKLIVDTRCEIYDSIKSHVDGIFWNFEQHLQKNELVPGAIYILGREQARLNCSQIQDLIKSNTIQVVYANPVEGSEPMEWNLRVCGFTEVLETGKMLVVTGGDINSKYSQFLYEVMLPKVHDYTENLQAIEEYSANQKTVRPYKFLFLNGRMRDHRKYLLLDFKERGLLDQALWSNLDNGRGVGSMGYPELKFNERQLSEFTFPAHYLPVEYEVDRYKDQARALPDTITHSLDFKFHLFKKEWGEIYLNSQAYLDTYFSVVTETVFQHPYSFRTEKIWKPIAIGHPFIVASNVGFYRDLHKQGYRTFGYLIDESFDTIDNDQQRIERIATVIEDLCQQDLPAFITAAQEVCKYNQQLFEEQRLKVQAEFPERLFQFIQKHFNE